MSQALYYPYVHVDVDWLKSSLLLFDSVHRMLPRGYQTGPRDDPRIAEFQSRGLLGTADIYSARAWQEQDRLATKIRASLEDPDFKRRYNRESTIAESGDPRGFQIYTGPSLQTVQGLLFQSDLAWGDPDSQYLHVHPRVGQVIMSTLAIACAVGEGLDIVGDERSGQLHRTLLELDLDEVYDALLGDARMPPPVQPSREELFEFLVAARCDVSGVTPEALANLDREPLRRMLDALRTQASKIRPMDPGAWRDEAFADAVNDIIKRWNEDQNNLDHYWRLFYQGASEPITAFVKVASDRVIVPLAIGGAAGAHIMAASPAVVALASALPGSLCVVAGGLILGLALNGIQSFSKMNREEKESPFQYLTLLQEAGVSFRGAETANRR